MSDEKIGGVIVYPDGSRHDDYLFRVSLKAVIFNNEGQVLIVREGGREWWDIPGGGLDHGESIETALARELYEEVSYSGNFEYEPILVEDAHIMKAINIYQMRAVFLVKPSNYDFQPGEDGDEIKYINPDEFKDSELITERQIYRYSQLALKRLISS